MTTEARPGTVYRECSDCGTPITGLGSSGKCRSHAPRRPTAPQATCALCPKGNVIPLETPRYQYVRVESGARRGKERRKRKLISTVCEPCWQARSSVGAN